tara:strand:+ start:241 stop:1524 length:1284 start_codon:yes stop_codon:yes gene_type:complete
MSKHLKQLKKLSKPQLGLASLDFASEELKLTNRRSSLGDLVFEAQENAIAAGILNDMVTKYHLKNIIDTKISTGLVVAEIKENCVNEKVIENSGTLISQFFGTGLSKEQSSPQTYQNLLRACNDYATESLNLYIDTLLNTGKLVIKLEKESGGGRELVVSKGSLIEIEKIVAAYYPTFEKNYIYYLPTYIDYKASIEKRKISFTDTSRTKSGFSEQTKIISESAKEYLVNDKLTRTKNSGTLRNSIGISLASLKTESDNAEKIRLKYGVNLLKDAKALVDSLNSEFNIIDNKVLSLKDSVSNVTNVQTSYDETKTKLGELLDGIDISYITKQNLIKIIPATSAHTLTLKIYSGERLDKIIRDTAAKGNFEVEITDLTDVEAKILVDNGYEIIESDNRVINGNVVGKELTWTIRWENSQFLLINPAKG